MGAKQRRKEGAGVLVGALATDEEAGIGVIHGCGRNDSLVDVVCPFIEKVGECIRQDEFEQPEHDDDAHCPPDEPVRPLYRRHHPQFVEDVHDPDIVNDLEVEAGIDEFHADEEDAKDTGNLGGLCADPLADRIETR